MNKLKKYIFVFILFSVFAAFLYAEDIIIDSKPFRMIFHEYSGTVSIFKQSAKSGKYVSLIDNSNYSMSTSFYLQVDERIIKLQRRIGLSISVDYIQNGAYVKYTIPNLATVQVSYIPFASETSLDTDCIKVEFSVQNIDSKSHNFAIKAIYDTILGESVKSHFVTANDFPIRSEFAFSNMKTYQAITSSNNVDSISFILNGEGISMPENVCIASKDLLHSAAWIPQIREGKSFDSVNTLNNSAIGLYWKADELASLTKGTSAFFLTCTDVKTILSSISKSATTIETDEEPTEESTSSYVDSYGTTYTVVANREEQLDPAYIADLLQRIKDFELKHDDSNRDEIKKLNAELDAIFAKLQKRQAESNEQ